MSHCKQCEHWGKKHESLDKRQCDKLDATPKLYLELGDPYGGFDVYTSEEFGCILFEKKN